MKYTDQEQFVMELRKAILESGVKQKDIADKLGIKPQYLTKMLNKKNFSLADAKKILDVIGYDLHFDIKKEAHTD